MVTVQYTPYTNATPWDVYQTEHMNKAEAYVISANMWRSIVEINRGGLYFIKPEYTQLELSHVNHGYAVNYVPSAVVYASEVNAHFPCDSSTCEYCDAVRGLLYEMVAEYDYRFVSGLDPVYYFEKTYRWSHSTTKYMWARTDRNIGNDVGDILTYDAWLALGHVSIDPDKLVWSLCSGCDKQVCLSILSDNDGYCSEECKEQYQVFYCYRCGNTHVAHEGDTCHSCSYTCNNCGYHISRSRHRNYDGLCSDCYDSNDSDSGDLYDSATGYHMGDVIPEDKYKDVDSCWINPNGEVICVPYCNHYDTAQRMGFSGTDAAERAGWIHVSTYWNVNRRFVHIPDRPSIEQYHTMWSLCDALGHEYPTELQAWIDRHRTEETREVIPMTYNVLQSVLPRKLRDAFYPLSGD